MNRILDSMVLQQTHASVLVRLLISTYFSNLTSILVIYNSEERSELRLEYLDAVQQTLHHSLHNDVLIGLQWLNVATLNEMQYEEQMLRAVDIATEGFITILPNTSYFLHVRYFATRNAELRLKDKIYLFLCEDENPKDLLQLEILQFYPHHLMVTPTITQTPMNVTQTNGMKEPRDTTTTITTKTIGLNNKFASVVGAPAPRQHINFELWTQKFVGVTANLDAVLLDSFEPNETFTRNVELYPNKLSNLEGRTLRVGSITYIPYVVTNYVRAGHGNVDPISLNSPNHSVFYDGSEANIVKTFCKVYHCHLRVEPYGVDNWGIIMENDSSSGMLGDIFKQRVELAIGCIYNWYNNITETSHSIARSAVTIMGPAPARFPAWRTNIMPFTDDLWKLLIVTMFFCALIFHLLKYFIQITKKRFIGNAQQFRHLNCFEESLLDMFAIFIQQPPPDKCVAGLSLRLFVMTLLMATITLENTYSGQLKSILTIPFYMEPVDTMQKWSETDWKWGAPSIVWVQTVEKSDMLMEQILTKKFETRTYEFLYNASFRDNYGLGIERLLSGAFSFGNYVTTPALETKIIPKDDLYFDWTRAVSIRGWPLMPQFNKHVRTCMETGLFVHWERKMVSQYIDRYTQEIILALASGHTTKAPPEKLTLENVSGAMFALLFGYLIAFLVLLLELFGHICKRKFLNWEHKSRILAQ